MPTNVRVRGKKGNKRQVLSKATKDEGRIVRLPYARPLSELEMLPNELIQTIFWDSLNLNLTLASPILARKLNNNSLRRRFVVLAFFESVFYTGIKPNVRGSSDKQRMTLYHDRHGTSCPHSVQCHLANKIIDQAWFSANLLFSCLQEYISKNVPQPFSDLFHPRYAVDTKPWAVLQNKYSERLPRWFVDLSHLRITSEQLLRIEQYWNFIERRRRGFCRKPKEHKPLTIPSTPNFGAGRIDVHLETSIYNFTDAPSFCWSIRESGKLRHQFVVGVIKWDTSGPELSHRLFNPPTWTIEDVNLLCGLVQRFALSRPSPEILAAIPKGVASAIQQKFVPAVFLLCSVDTTAEDEEVSAAKHDIYVDLVGQFLDNELSRYKDSGASVGSFTLLEYHLWDPCLSSIASCVMSSIRSDYLIKAMKSACEPKATVDTYYIFCWITVGFITDMTNQNLPFPEETLKQVHCLQLLADESEYASKCYEYLNTALNKVWNLN